MASLTLRRGSTVCRATALSARASPSASASTAARPPPMRPPHLSHKLVTPQMPFTTSSSSSSSSAPPTSSSPRQQYERLAGAVDAAAAQAKAQIKSAAELSYTVDAYAASLKAEASSRLQVSPWIMETPDPARALQRLAARCMMALNLDNNAPGLDWTALHPALGVPLLKHMLRSGHTDAFGLPVFLQQQQGQQPFELDLCGYHALMQQRGPRWVGRCVESYWSDTVVAEPHPFPVIAVSDLAQELLSVRVLESVLQGFAAGRQLLEACAGAAQPATPLTATPAAAASWFDLALSHPCAVLGVLLLSKPDLPLVAFLRRQAAAAAASTAEPAATGAARASADAPSLVDRIRMAAAGGGSGAVLCGEVEGGRVWGVGHITAVGAGDCGNAPAWSLLVPALEGQEDESCAVPVASSQKALSTAAVVAKMGAACSRLLASWWH